jgi:hypothetical protein
MDALNYLRHEIKSYFPESSELQLSESYARQPRFNFYFEVLPGERFLLYLNWDGDRFTLKCLEFIGSDMLKGLMNAYPEWGSRVFNAGKPRATVSFDYYEKDRLGALKFFGNISEQIHSHEISGKQLLQCVDPFRNV